MTTPRKSRENPAVREFILQNVGAHPTGIAALTAKQFGLSRAAVNNYVRKLVRQGLLDATGKTYARRYWLKLIAHHVAKIAVGPETAEHDVWRQHIEPQLKGVKENVVNICYYGFTEIFNNVIDHSQSHDALISYQQNYTTITLLVIDYGVGIFEKIQKDFNLADPRTALLELAKGKLTSDKTRHSGEGIFFASRMFDKFTILSGKLFYSRTRQDDWGWLIETKDTADYVKGTTVSMSLSTAADWTTQSVFEKFTRADEDDVSRFVKTHVPITLGKYGHEQLVSRSQAKRILARFEGFKEILLDFYGVETIGQAFADEIFRVFATAHPNITLIAMNTSPAVRAMIDRAEHEIAPDITEPGSNAPGGASV